jgi:penicillin amidase
MASGLASVVPRFPAPFTLPASASNEWAVDGAHSATGAPLLAGDPHLGFSQPPIWYLARIETPGHVLVGATAPGSPAMVLGHNGHIAWTFTSNGADVQDLFIETPQGDGYQTEDGPRPFVTRTEVIAVRGQPDVIMKVRETRHGPVISDLSPNAGPMLALAMANLAPGDGAAVGLLALNRATNVAEAEATAEQITSPVLNLLVADTHTIGLFVTGRVPVRRSGDGAFPAQGNDGRSDWIGWAQGAALPHTISPASGRLVNANERVAGPDFPVFLGRDWYNDVRARRIRQMLDATPKPDGTDFTRMQVDDLDLVAVELLPKLQAIEPDFAGWDGRMTVDAAQPLIFNTWMPEFAHRLLFALHVPESEWDAAAPWPDLVRSALGVGGSVLCGDRCDAMLHQSHERAIARLTQRFGADRAAWHWGSAHQVVFATSALRAIPWLGPLTEARIAEAGDDSTVGRGGLRTDTLEAVHGAGYRGVYDLADLERSRFMVVPGQSGDPASRFARNFMHEWRDGHTIVIRHQPDTISAHIRLTP